MDSMRAERANRPHRFYVSNLSRADTREQLADMILQLRHIRPLDSAHGPADQLLLSRLG
jgi:hypothetical protein